MTALRQQAEDFDESTTWDEDRLLTELLQIQQAEKLLKDRKTKYSGHLLERLSANHQTKYDGQFGSATVQYKTTRTLNADKLVAHGVDPVVIKDCTDEKVSDPFIVVRAAKVEV